MIQTNPQEHGDTYFIHVAIRTDIKSEKDKVIGKLENFNYKIDEAKTHGSGCDLDLALNNILVKDIMMYLKIMEDKKAVHALEKLLHVLKLEQDDTNRKKFELSKFNF